VSFIIYGIIGWYLWKWLFTMDNPLPPNYNPDVPYGDMPKDDD
jgi:hypothetical protein